MKAFRNLLRAAVAVGSIALLSAGASGTAAAEELDTIKEKGVIRIAMSGAYPPFNFVNEQNEVVGFDPAIGTEIAKRMGLEVEIVTTAWDGIIGGLLANKYDAIVGSMSITEERDKVVDFVVELADVKDKKTSREELVKLVREGEDGFDIDADHDH